MSRPKKQPVRGGDREPFTTCKTNRLNAASAGIATGMGIDRPYLKSAADGLGFSRLGFCDLIENRSFGESGRPLGALEPFEKVGGEAPYLFKWF